MLARQLIATIALFTSFAALAAPHQDVVDSVDDQLTPRHWSRLPLLGEEARKRGYQLPLPIGVTVFYSHIDAPYEADGDFLVQVDGGVFGRVAPGDVLIPKEDVDIQGDDKSVQLKIDAWLLPFLNVYALLGYVDGHKDIKAKLDNVEGLDCGRLPCPDLTGVTLPIPIEYDATNWGLGLVLAGQVEVVDHWNPFIVAAVGSFVQAETNTTDSTIKTTIGQLRIGQRYDVRGDKLAWFLAYKYQNIRQNITGDYSFVGTELESLFEEVRYDVDLKRAETHNMAVSMMYEFGAMNQWNLYAEYGFLNWDQLTIGVGHRF